MNDKDIPALLLFISRVNEGEKIVTSNCTIHDAENYWDKLKRTFWYSENKHKTYRWMYDIIDQAFDLYDSLKPVTPENRKVADNILENIKKSKEGIRNMKKTYSKDTYYCARLDELLTHIDIKIGIRDKMSEKKQVRERVVQDKEIEEEFGTDSYNIINKEITNKTKSGKQISVEGMYVFKDIINAKTEDDLLKFFEGEFDRRGIARGDRSRTMYYGIKDLEYDGDEVIPPLPEELTPLVYQLIYKDIFDKIAQPECLEVKEYTGTQGVMMKQPEEFIFFVMVVLGDPWCCFTKTPDYGGTTLGMKLVPRLAITFNAKNCNYVIPRTRRQDIKGHTMSRKPNFRMMTLTFKKLNEIDL